MNFHDHFNYKCSHFYKNVNIKLHGLSKILKFTVLLKYKYKSSRFYYNINIKVEGSTRIKRTDS